MLQRAAVCCNTIAKGDMRLQASNKCVAVCCSVLLCITVCCSALQHKRHPMDLGHRVVKNRCSCSVCCSVLQFTTLFSVRGLELGLKVEGLEDFEFMN